MDAYDLESTVGRGAFAVCLSARRREDGRQVVVKKLNLPVSQLSARELEDAQNEIETLATLNHPNIVQFIGHFIDDGVQHIVMEFASGGTLGTVSLFLLLINDA